MKASKFRRCTFGRVDLTIGWPFLLIFGALAGSLRADEEPSSTYLPPPISRPVDFIRDVQPIFMDACYRCHGPRRQKSGFRLDDPAAAMEGGDYGKAILPGNSMESPLIEYVAHLEPDMEMPPLDNGDPLTNEQIGILRAWIDQGAKWEALDPNADFEPSQVWSFSPMTRWIEVKGASRLFEEQTGMRSGWTTGIQSFQYDTQLSPNETFSASGRALAGQEDYELTLDYQNTDLGYIRGGWSSYREFDNSIGGYYRPFNLSSIDLRRDLTMDYQRLWVDFGWTPNPEALVELSYDFRVRDGFKSLLQWGLVSDPAFIAGDRAIYPALKGLREERHTIQLTVQREFNELRLKDQLQLSLTDYKSERVTTDFSPFFGNKYQEDQDSWQISNALQVDKRMQDWLLVSGGYLFSKWKADGSFTQLGFDPSQPAAPAFLNDYASPIQLKRETHLFNAAALLGPWEDFSISLGLQNEWTRQNGIGSGLGFGFAPLTYQSNLDLIGLEEEVTFTYKGIPKTTIYWDNRFRQESIDQYENSFQDDGFGSSRDFMRDTDAGNETYTSKAGVQFNPMRPMSVSLNYGPKLRRNWFDHDLDQSGDTPSGNGYPALIRFRETLTHEARARISMRWNTQLRSSIQYIWNRTDYRTKINSWTNPNTSALIAGSGIEAGDYQSDSIYLSNSWNPTTWFSWTMGASYGWTELVTGMSAFGSVVPYRGKIYGAQNGWTFYLPWESSINLQYLFSASDYSQSNETDGLPLGVEYQRQGITTGYSKNFSESLSGSLQYGYFDYKEPSMGGAYDYQAHSVLLMLNAVFN